MAIELNIFEHVRDSGETGISTHELAAKIGAEEALMCKY